MVFNFLKYLKPTWYYNLKPEKDFGYFPSIITLQKNEIPFLIDVNYKSDVASERDVAWTAFQEGYINKNFQDGINVWKNVTLPIHDEYVFLRKNFHAAWVFYVLCIRLLTFKNPFLEIPSFFRTRFVARKHYSNHNFNTIEYENFQSNLLIEQPFISVIIPTLNRYQYLKDVLIDLEKQVYKNFEVIIVDQSDDFNEDFYSNWKLRLTFWQQKEKALWKARNEAIKFSKANYILLYDDDSLIDQNWIVEHLKALDFFNADISSGVSISKVGDKIPAHYSYFRWSEQLDTGNVLIKKQVFDKIGLFDLKFEKQRMGDGEFGLRAYLNGFKNISNYKAKRIHLKVNQGGLRHVGSWDAWRPNALFGPRPVPSVLYLSRKYFGKHLTRFYIINAIIPSIVPYKFKKSKFLKCIAVFFIPFYLPLICFQVFKSWRKSSKMLID